MKLTKLSNYVGFKISKPDDYIQTVDTDLINIFNTFKGRIRFGSATDGYRGENIAGEFQIFTSNSSSTSNVVVAHTLGSAPVGFLMINKTQLADAYMVSATTANATFAVGMTSTTYTVFLLK